MKKKTVSLGIYVAKTKRGKTHATTITETGINYGRIWCNTAADLSEGKQVAGGITCEKCLKKLNVLPKSIAKTYGLEKYCLVDGGIRGN